MIRAIGKLVEAMRERGVRVSTAEAVDAANAAGAVGIESRESLRTALRAALAKGRKERSAFDEIFDKVFSAPSFGRGKSAAPAERAGGDGRRAGGGRGVSAFSDANPETSSAFPSRTVSDSRRRAASSAAGPVREPLRRRTLASQPERSRPVRGGGADSSSPVTFRKERLRRIVTSRVTPDGPRSGVAPPGSAEREAAGFRKPEGVHDSGSLLERDLAQPLGEEEEKLLSEMIPRIVQRIRLSKARRLVRSNRGRVWPRGILRANLRHGGVPFVLPVRARKRRPARVVLLVDVSYSVARSAGLFLGIVMRFLRVNPNVRVFLFVDRCVDATARLREWMRGRPGGEPLSAWGGGSGRRAVAGRGIVPVAGGRSFLAVLSELRELNLQAPSDYGRAFFSLERMARLGGRNTVLIVLGDARVNRFDPLPWTFSDLTDHCRRVIWLVPEPRHLWMTGDSALAEYLPSCDLAVEAKDLIGLENGVREVLRSL